jgi:hypothetical protein
MLAAILLLLVASSCQDLNPSAGDGDDQGNGEVAATETPIPPPQVDLAYGDNVSEVLISSRGELWTFSGESGDVVTITMSSEEFDAFLALFDPSGNYLTCDDDGGEQRNASIIDFPLPSSGVYTINAMGLVPDAGGAYSLMISQTTNSLLHPTAGGGSLNIGDTKTNSLAVWTGDAWTFNGSVGDVISVGARSGYFDTVLTIYGPDLHREASDDDGLGNFNSLVAGLTLPSSGRYTIVARAFDDTALGSYELGTAAGTEIPGWEMAGPGGGEYISYGETAQGNLPGVRGEQWAFSGSAGDSVSISADSEEFDTFLVLFGPGGEYLTCDDDNGDGFNSLISGYTLPASGMYYIDVLSYGAGASGAYSLTLGQTSAGVIPSSINSAVIGYGSTVDQWLGTWVGDVWTFSGNAGDVVTISMTSADFDTFLDLYGPTLLRVAMDDDGGGDTNSEISSVVLSATGIYTIVARSFSPEGAGSYTLSLHSIP